MPHPPLSVASDGVLIRARWESEALKLWVWVRGSQTVSLKSLCREVCMCIGGNILSWTATRHMVYRVISVRAFRLQWILFLRSPPTKTTLRVVIMPSEYQTARLWARLQVGQDLPFCRISGSYNKNVSLLSFKSSSVLLKSSYYILAKARRYHGRFCQYAEALSPWYEDNAIRRLRHKSIAL